MIITHFVTTGCLDNLLGPLTQEILDAQDNSISDQDNNVAVSQGLFADNDCDGTDGNSVRCTTTAYRILLTTLITLKDITR